jgi:hypothetical protein
VIYPRCWLPGWWPWHESSGVDDAGLVLGLSCGVFACFLMFLVDFFWPVLAGENSLCCRDAWGSSPVIISLVIPG